MTLVFRHEPLNKQLHEANPSQASHHLGPLCIIASPPLKRMVYQKGNRLETLLSTSGLLDLIDVVYFQQKFFRNTCLAKSQ